MRIGIDFDNTVAGYDRLFARLAVEAGLIKDARTCGKTQVRDLLRARGDEGEVAWQVLQAQAYGPRMGEAEMLDGVAAFLAECRARALPVFVVSHKTRFARRDEERRWDMREAALGWMERMGFFAADEFGLPRDHVVFEDTRDAKVARIAALGCTHFIDDLEEVFSHPGFPSGVEAFLLADGVAGAGKTRRWSWDGIRSALFGKAEADAGR